MMLWTPLLACSAAIGAPITTGTLLGETYDLDRLTTVTAPAHKLVQFSSYDRRSVAPYAPDWYENSDGFGGEPIPNFLATLEEPNAEGVGRYLMAEVDGPGALVRTWSAAHAGSIRLYLDGSTTPLYDGPAERFLIWTSKHFREQLGLPAPDDDGFHQNMACYLPMPFARGMRIEWIGKKEDIHFYHIEARIYPEGTEVQTFAPADLETYAAEYDRAAASLLGTPWPAPEGAEAREIGLTVEPKTRAEALLVEGAAEIAELTLRADARDRTAALRQTILRIHFDGSAQPQVEAPVGDFFGAGVGVNPYESLPFSVKPDGSMVCRFRMPFARSARIVLENLGEQPVTVTGTAQVRPRAWTDDSLQFHCIWEVDHDLVAQGGHDVFDVPILNAHGRGHFVGVAVQLNNPAPIPTEGGNWWGEGDEKVYVDDDTFPSLFGTGSEDYFNYAWSRPDHFWHAYCAQPLNTGPGTRGLVANNRWHILDAIPFSREIGFYLELFCHTRVPGFTYARSAYFYADERVRDRRVPITEADVHQGLTLAYGWEPMAAGGATGATFFDAETALAPGQDNTRVLEGALFAGAKSLLWSPKAEGEQLRFRVDVPAAGRYQIALTAALAPSNGRFRLAIDDGKPTDHAIDLFSPYHEVERNYFFATLDLAAGEHTITLQSAGRNEASAGDGIGIDYLWVIKR